MKNTEKTMEKVVALCKGRGFIFPGSEIYGGLANTWDYGPLGARMKNNVRKNMNNDILLAFIQLLFPNTHFPVVDFFATKENKSATTINKI